MIPDLGTMPSSAVAWLERDYDSWEIQTEFASDTDGLMVCFIVDHPNPEDSSPGHIAPMFTIKDDSSGIFCAQYDYSCVQGPTLPDGDPVLDVEGQRRAQASLDAADEARGRQRVDAELRGGSITFEGRPPLSQWVAYGTVGPRPWRLPPSIRDAVDLRADVEWQRRFFDADIGPAWQAQFFDHAVSQAGVEEANAAFFDHAVSQAGVEEANAAFFDHAVSQAGVEEANAAWQGLPEYMIVDEVHGSYSVPADELVFTRDPLAQLPLQARHLLNDWTRATEKNDDWIEDVT